MTPTKAASWSAGAATAAAAWTTGDVKLSLKTVADSGWILANDGTIGDASSSATTRANADTSALYTLLWTNVSDTYAPVTGGRGASAAADFGAHKPIAITKMLGRALAIAGTGSDLTARTLGQTLGEETHVLTTTEMPAHTHKYTSGGNTAGGGGGGPVGFFSGTNAADTASAGSDGAHNNMQPTSFLNVMIKL
jgi:microcystin-dependent protein